MKKRINPESMSLRQLASRKGVNAGSVAFWTSQGCPRKADGTFRLADVDEWLKQASERKAKGKDLRAEKLKHEITRIKRDIAQRDIAIARDKGEVHSKAECAASLVEVRAAESRVIGAVAQSFRGAFPEASAAQVDWLARWARECLARLNGGAQ